MITAVEQAAEFGALRVAAVKPTATFYHQTPNGVNTKNTAGRSHRQCLLRFVNAALDQSKEFRKRSYSARALPSSASSKSGQKVGVE